MTSCDEEVVADERERGKPLSILGPAAGGADGEPWRVQGPGAADCEYGQLAAASGFTPQYQGLEELYRTYNEREFEVLGFPCNQFGAQEPGTTEEIGAFCERNYGVSFPLFAKIDVNGPRAHPLYRFLKKNKRGLFGTERIKWNFTKFIVDREGNVVSRHTPSTKPEELAVRIEELLGGR